MLAIIEDHLRAVEQGGSLQLALAEVLAVLARHDDGADAAAVRREELLLQAPDGGDLAAQRDLARHRHVGAHRNPGQCRHEGRGHRDARARAVLGRGAIGHVDVNVALLEQFGADIAEMFIVFTRVDDLPGGAGIGCVLVPKGTPGLSAKATYRTMAGDWLCDVTLENCELPADHLILKHNSMKTLINAFNAQRCLNAAICLGLAEGARLCPR